MRVLVIGGTNFIGPHVVAALDRLRKPEPDLLGRSFQAGAGGGLGADEIRMGAGGTGNDEGQSETGEGGENCWPSRS